MPVLHSLMHPHLIQLNCSNDLDMTLFISQRTKQMHKKKQKIGNIDTVIPTVSWGWILRQYMTGHKGELKGKVFMNEMLTVRGPQAEAACICLYTFTSANIHPSTYLFIFSLSIHPSLCPFVWPSLHPSLYNKRRGPAGENSTIDLKPICLL